MSVSIAEIVKAHKLEGEVRDLIWKYHLQVAPITDKYSVALEKVEIAEDDLLHEQYLKELLPHWRKLAGNVRKLVRQARKGKYVPETGAKPGHAPEDV